MVKKAGSRKPNPPRARAKKAAVKRAPAKDAAVKRARARKVAAPRTGLTAESDSGEPRGRPPAAGAAPARIVIEDVSPAVGGGRFPVKRVVGEPVVVSATVYADGHDRLWCVVAHHAGTPSGQLPSPAADAGHDRPSPPAADQAWRHVPLKVSNPGLDEWRGDFVPLAEGVHRFKVLAWIDEFGSWASATTRKRDAGVPIDSERLEGAAILERAADRHEAAARPVEAGALRAAAGDLRAGDISALTDQGGGTRRSPAELVHASLGEGSAVVSETCEVLVERERALFSSWYELFPRSWAPDGGVHGTLADVERQLGYVADMGFDILYLPPIHPIGRAFRKGPNNMESGGPDAVGSPWAIGGPEGGHTAIHPALGTAEDLRSLRRACAANGIELALDIAFQCSPDHPWVRERPQWFKHRPDGTIQYAENPPKKYQDIYPLDFDTVDWEALWAALRDVFVHWMDEGVRVFRVDNPHTKPFTFWEWVIPELRRRDPGVILLSEAFTRPRVMHRLAQVGFTQSYSYFPWRVTKDELVEHFTELSRAPSVDELRPSAWPNTPDILPWHLMHAPRAMFAVRAFVAATLSPSWGIYGPAFELGEATPAGNGKEEYLHSEKYEIKQWNLHDPASLRSLIGELNRIRTANLALHTLRTLRFHIIENDALVCFSKTAHSGPSADPANAPGATVLVVANLDPHHRQAAFTRLDLAELGVAPELPFEVQDLMTGRRFTWHGPRNYVELDPGSQPGHIFRVTQG